jgi:hypothetical protein
VRRRARVVAAMSLCSMSVAGCSGGSPGSLSPLVGSAVENSSTSVRLDAPTTLAVTTTTAAITTTTATTVLTATTAAPVAPVTVDPHGAAIEVGCIRSNIDFAAVRVAPGVGQAEVGRIPPSTCDVRVYATGTDGSIAWLEVGIGDVFGWSAQSNFVQSSFGPPPPVVSATPVPVVPSGAAELDFRARTVFGFRVGYLSVDQVLGVISARLGPASSDSGWLPAVAGDPEDGCSGTPPARRVSWGDLSMVFFQVPQAGSSAPVSEYLSTWSVGDAAVLFGQAAGPQVSATGLRTAEGIGVGSTIESVTAAYGQEFPFDAGNSGSQVVPGEPDQNTGVAIMLLAVGGSITGIGSMVLAC